MRLTLFIILSSVYLTGATELYQLLKLPYLVTHYQHHREEDRSMSLVDFLRIHYLDNHPADNDDQEDNQLPFKSDGTIGHPEPATPLAKELQEKCSFPYSCNKNTIHPEGMLLHRAFSVFHPPRFV